MKTCMFLEIGHLQKALSTRACVHCSSCDVKVQLKSLNGLVWTLKVTCCSCGDTQNLTTVDKTFNDTVLLATMSNGITVSQFNNLLWSLNFAGKTDTGLDRAVDLTTKANTDRRNQLRKQVVEFGQEQQAAYLKSVCDNDSIHTVVGMIDGCYPTRGFSSKCCIVTLILQYEQDSSTVTKIAAQVVVKKGKKKTTAVTDGAETGEADEADDAEADQFADIQELWAETTSKMLEGKGAEYLISGPVKKLLDAGKHVKLGFSSTACCCLYSRYT